MRMNAVLPVWSEKENLTAFILYNVIDTLVIISAMWVFALKYH